MSYVGADPNELHNVAGILASCATHIEGAAQQAQASFSMANTWHDGHRPRFEEAVGNGAAQMQNYAQMLNQMSGQINTLAQKYEDLRSGG